MPWRDGTGPPWLHGKFRGCGYRLTVPRQIILDVLSKTSKHLSAEDIYHAVHKGYPAIGLTTVYRTLELLVQMGLVFKFDFGDGRARYELSEGPKGARHHHHLVCTDCGRAIDYTDFIDGTENPGGNLSVLSMQSGEVNDILPSMSDGIFGRYDVSFDAQKVVFDWKEKIGKGCRIFEAGIDGQGLRQLTFEPPDEQDRIKKYDNSNSSSVGISAKDVKLPVIALLFPNTKFVNARV